MVEARVAIRNQPSEHRELIAEEVTGRDAATRRLRRHSATMSSITIRSARQIRATVRAGDPSTFDVPIAALSVSELDTARAQRRDPAEVLRMLPGSLTVTSLGLPRPPTWASQWPLTRSEKGVRRGGRPLSSAA